MTLNNHGKPNIMNYDILQIPTTLISVILLFHQVLNIRGHTQSVVTKVLPLLVSCIDMFACPVHLYAQINNALHTGTDTKSQLCRKVNIISI
jgi:hypothetical protein